MGGPRLCRRVRGDAQQRAMSVARASRPDTSRRLATPLQAESKRCRDASHYHLLGVKITATAEEIKRAYRRASVRWHPDKHANDPTNRTRATAHFKRINEAKQVLCQAGERVLYDMQLRRARHRRKLWSTSHSYDDSDSDSESEQEWPWRTSEEMAALKRKEAEAELRKQTELRKVSAERRVALRYPSTSGACDIASVQQLCLAWGRGGRVATWRRHALRRSLLGGRGRWPAEEGAEGALPGGVHAESTLCCGAGLAATGGGAGGAAARVRAVAAAARDRARGRRAETRGAASVLDAAGRRAFRDRRRRGREDRGD